MKAIYLICEPRGAIPIFSNLDLTHEPPEKVGGYPEFSNFLIGMKNLYFMGNKTTGFRKTITKSLRNVFNSINPLSRRDCPLQFHIFADFSNIFQEEVEVVFSSYSSMANSRFLAETPWAAYLKGIFCGVGRYLSRNLR